MYLCKCVHVSAGSQKRASGALELELGVCELPSMGAGNQICPLNRSPLSSPGIYLLT